MDTEQPRTSPSPLVRPVPEGLVIRKGSHGEFDNGACVMEAVAWVAGERHSDAPICACPVIRRFAININDRIDDDALRTRLFLPLVTRLVGSRSTDRVAAFRARLAADWAIRGSLPVWWAQVPWLKKHAEVLRALPPLVTPEALQHARSVIRAQRRDIEVYWAGGSCRSRPTSNCSRKPARGCDRSGSPCGRQRSSPSIACCRSHRR